jgi:hypothetical protein
MPSRYCDDALGAWWSRPARSDPCTVAFSMATPCATGKSRSSARKGTTKDTVDTHGRIVYHNTSICRSFTESGAKVNLRQRLIVSVSTLALMSSGAYAIELGPDAARTQHLLTQEETAQLPAQTDMNLPRAFTVFLKPGAAGSEQLVQTYFRSFGFRTEYFPYTNSVKLQGTFAQAEMAGHFTYVAGRLPITPLRTGTEPTFPPAVKNAILVTTFNPGPVMKPFFSVTVNTPTTMPQHLGVYGLAPSDYGAIYGYNQLYGAGYNGSGQIVDIAACHGYSTSDLTTFHTDFGLSPAPNVTAVTANNPVASSIEPDLDVQRVYGTAPGATIRMWFSATCAIGDFANLFTDIANDQATHRLLR